MTKFYAEFNKYLLSGGIATIVHYLTLIVGVEIFSSSPLIATTGGAIFGAITNFILNKVYVFKKKSLCYKEAINYLGVIICSTLLNYLVMKICFIVLLWNYIISQFTATFLVVMINFICCKKIIFKELPSG